MKTLVPPQIAPPFSNYSHGIELPPGQRIVMISGQLGMDREGVIPPDCGGQCRIIFDNITAILGQAGMVLGDIVKLNAYVTGREHLPGYMAVRNEFFPAPFPASTLMMVSGFARPEFVVEIEAIAAAPVEART